MIITFADATPSANMIIIVLTFIVSICAGLATIGLWWQGRGKRTMEVSPQPLQIELAKKFAEKIDFEEQKKHCTKRHNELFNGIDAVAENASKEMASLARQVAALQVETKMQSQQLRKLDTMEKELRDMPGKIVVDILNAQKLGRIK